MTWDQLCERFAADYEQLAADYLGRWVVYTEAGVVADRETERQALWVAFNVHGEDRFIVDQIREERPTVFIGGGGLGLVDTAP